MRAWASDWASSAASEVCRQMVQRADAHELAVQVTDPLSGETRTLEGQLEEDAASRARALEWVGELDGKGRADRIRACGFMELAYHPTTRRVGWRNRWCRDRACPGCAKRRANSLRHQLRAHLEERRADREKPAGELLFVTLTQPKRGLQVEAPGESVTRLLDSWRKLTNRRGFRAVVQGYLRATEVTYSKRGFAGWHAHLHCVIELAHGMGKRAKRDVQRYIKRNWCELVGGDEKAQNFQALDAAKLGQVVKYITKPFALPASLAPTFFEDMKGRKLISGAGTWRDYSKHDQGYQHAPGWIPQSSHVAELVDAASKGGRWTFRWLLTEDGTAKPVCPWRPPDVDELVKSTTMDAAEAWRALAHDCRSIGARSKSPGAERSAALDPGEAPAALCPHAAKPAATPTRQSPRAAPSRPARPPPQQCSLRSP